MAVVFDASILIAALAEFLVKAGRAREQFLRELDKRSTFSIEHFDKKAAIECALLLEEAWSRAEQGKVHRTKFKFDWQIVSIAASRNAAVIYSDDPDIAKAAARRHITVVATDSLPVPSSALQKNLSFEAPVTGESDEGKP